MYHMNPETGQISLCSATLRTCKYSKENHFATWGEAQMAQDVKFAAEYAQLPAVKQVEQELERAKAESVGKYSELEKESKNRKLALCETSGDQKFLTAVFYREVFDSEGYEYIQAVLENKSFPREIKENITQYPNVWAPELVKLCVDSPNFTEEDVVGIGKATNDQDVREKALLSKKLSKRRIVGAIDSNEMDMYQYEVVLRNPNVPSQWYWDYSELWVTKETVNKITPAAYRRLEEYNRALSANRG